VPKFRQFALYLPGYEFAVTKGSAPSQPHISGWVYYSKEVYTPDVAYEP